MDWFPVWKAQDFRTPGGKLVKFLKLLHYVCHLSKNRIVPMIFNKAKAHQRTITLESTINNVADLAAKEGARVGPAWVLQTQTNLAVCPRLHCPLLMLLI